MVYVAELRSICENYNKRIATLEDQKYDVEFLVQRKDCEVSLIDHAHNILLPLNVLVMCLLHIIFFLLLTFIFVSSKLKQKILLSTVIRAMRTRPFC